MVFVEGLCLATTLDMQCSGHDVFYPEEHTERLIEFTFELRTIVKEKEAGDPQWNDLMTKKDRWNITTVV